MTTDYKTVFQLAQDKGYNPEYRVDLSPKEQMSQFADHYPDECRYIDLCLIQKWLRDEYKIVVTSFIVDVDCYAFSLDFIEALVNMKGSTDEGMRAVCVIEYEQQKGYAFPNLEEMKKHNYSYESALLEGINEALKLI